MSKLSKLFRSDAGKILVPLATGYAKKQSADVRKVAPVVETVLSVHQAVKASGSEEVLKDTIYAVAENKVLQGVLMSNELQAPSVAPVKPAFSTSTFKIGAIAALLTPLIPILYKMAENWIGTLPPGSPLAMVMPGVLAALWGLFRYLTTNGERQATAQVATAQAQAIGAQNKAPDAINAGGDVTLESNTSAPFADDGFEMDLSPSSGGDMTLNAEAVMEQERENNARD